MEHNPAGSKPDSASPQNQLVNSLVNAQNESLGHINHTCKSVGIEYVLITDEDVLMALDGDSRLKSLTRPQLETIKEQIQEGLMEYWEHTVMESINNVLGESDDAKDPELLHEDRHDELEGGESYT